MRPTGPAGVAARRRRVAAGGAVQPLQASSVCGVMARQGRCVAKAGVRDAASRAASKHAEAWVCPPASCFLPPFRSASLSPAPLPLPGVRSSARRLREARRAGRPMEGVDVGCGAAGGLLRRRGLEKAYRSSLSVSAMHRLIIAVGVLAALVGCGSGNSSTVRVMTDEEPAAAEQRATAWRAERPPHPAPLRSPSSTRHARSACTPRPPRRSPGRPSVHADAAPRRPRRQRGRRGSWTGFSSLVRSACRAGDSGERCRADFRPFLNSGVHPGLDCVLEMKEQVETAPLLVHRPTVNILTHCERWPKLLFET